MLYGRDSERAEIGALLDGARSSHSGAVVISGEAGVGKTALLIDARERAVDMSVLHARGVESESELAFAGLHQLFAPGWLSLMTCRLRRRRPFVGPLDWRILMATNAS